MRLATARSLGRRCYAQLAQDSHSAVSRSLLCAYDRRILQEFHDHRQSAPGCMPLPQLLDQLQALAGHVLDYILPYESTPLSSRRVDFDAAHPGLVSVSHVVDDGGQPEVHTSTGFAIHMPGHDATAILTCAHTLQEISHSRLLEKAAVHSGTLISTSQGQTVPTSGVLSSLPWHDLLLLSVSTPASMSIPSLPISPYPAPIGSASQLPLLESEPKNAAISSSWKSGIILGYRDSCGRPAEPGTYDTLSQVLFSPFPTHGTSGAPLVDELSGALVGVALGTKVETGSFVGYGVPSEVIYEMFCLPGMRKAQH